MEHRLQAHRRPCGDGDPFAALRSDDAYCEPAATAAADGPDEQMAALDALIEAQRLARRKMQDQIDNLQDQYLKVSSELQSTLDAGKPQEFEALRDELSRERHHSRCLTQEAAAAAVALAEARADAQQQRVLTDCTLRRLEALRTRCAQLEERRLPAGEEPERLKRIITPGSCKSAECAATLRLERRNAERLAQKVKRLQLLLAANDAAAEPAAPAAAAAPSASTAAEPAAAVTASSASAAAAPAGSKRTDRRPLSSSPASAAARPANRGPPAQQQLQKAQQPSAASKNGAAATAKRSARGASAASASPGRGAAAAAAAGSSESQPAPSAQDLLDWLSGLPDRFNKQLQALVSPESPTEQVGPALLVDCPTPPPDADLETASRQVVDWLVRVWNDRLQRIVVASLTRRLPHSAGGTVLYYFVQQLLDTGCPLPAKLRTDFLRRLDGFPGNGRLRQDVHQVKMRVRPIAVTRALGAAAAPAASSPAAAAAKRAQGGSASSRRPATAAASATPRTPRTAAVDPQLKARQAKQQPG
uniref:CortBP2 domain-containing protein n=1 Tax=Macrostomum lignano TaxID=282301 RepID=A0A1I8G7E7_9PLAT